MNTSSTEFAKKMLELSSRNAWRSKCSEWCATRSSLIQTISDLKRRNFQMDNQSKTKCAHIPCACEVPPSQEYCSEACRNAGSEDVEIACQCDHAACPLTA